MIKKIAFIGATGMLGLPVVRHIVESGIEVTTLTRNPGKAKESLPPGVLFIRGDIKSATDVSRLFEGQEYVYISLSVPQTEKKSDWHSETDGMKIIVEQAKLHKIKRLILLSSLVQRYQGMNHFSWWVFDIKNKAIEIVKQSGIPHTIFYPSTFMESFIGKYKQGKRILMSGESEYPMYYISGTDYGHQVVRSLQRASNENLEYVIQGPEPLRPEVAAEIFIQNYKKEKLKISTAPYGLLKFLGKFSTTINYGVHIIEALNRYPEKFESEKAWEELGRPNTTLRDFAESL